MYTHILAKKEKKKETSCGLTHLLQWWARKHIDNHLRQKRRQNYLTFKCRVKALYRAVDTVIKVYTSSLKPSPLASWSYSLAQVWPSLNAPLRQTNTSKSNVAKLSNAHYTSTNSSLASFFACSCCSPQHLALLPSCDFIQCCLEDAVCIRAPVHFNKPNWGSFCKNCFFTPSSICFMHSFICFDIPFFLKSFCWCCGCWDKRKCFRK